MSALAHEHYCIFVVASVAELDALEQRNADFVIFDVTPERLLPALQALRARARWRETPALVRAERLADLTELAGICPSYRALICHHVDLLTLLNHHAQHTAAPDKPHHLL
ncbi:MAG: hypothetical protein HOP19_19850 [Acidobacteria bacterium]|nr:hypothetical protein [Acidobacteriota bacterium]